MKRPVLFTLVALALLSLVPVQARQPGPPRTYTCSWSHDGVQTDTYTIWVDGAQSVSVPVTNCTGTAPALSCSSPLTMTTNVAHTVIVKAENAFGWADSSPFISGPPGSRPVGVVIR